MQSFKYVARDANGKIFRGVVLTESRDAAFRKLKDGGLYSLKLEEIGEDAHRPQRVRLKEVAFFCRQMGTMLAAGVTVLKAIDILCSRADRPKTRKAYLRLYEDIQKGLSLTEAFKEQEGVFPPLLVNMVQAGELSGSLDRVMERMAEHYEKENRILNKVRSSLVYPVLLVCVTLGVVIGLFVFVLPSFFTMFEGAEVPPITRGVMAVSGFLTNRWYLVVVAVLLLGLGWIFLSGMPRVRMWIDRLKIRIPVFGKLIMTVYVSRMTDALSILYSSGISMLDTVSIAVSVLGNSYIEGRFGQVIQDIEQGEMLSAAIEKTGLFDPMVTSVIYVGEQSGSLDRILEKLSAFYDDEAQTAMQRMVTLVEPLMMIVIAIIIGIVIAAVLLPIYSMYGTVL